jgi:hypothetical protein
MGTISHTAAWSRVARARYGNAWVEHLDERELWLVRRYSRIAKAPLLPRHISYVGPGGYNWRDLVGSPALCEEIVRAIDRHDCAKEQYEWLVDWFDQHGLPDDGPIDLAAFERAMARDFPAIASNIPALQAGPEPTNKEPIKNTERRRDTFAVWIKQRYAKELSSPYPWLPNRDDLAEEGRHHVAKNINRGDAAEVRRRLLPADARKGGARARKPTGT